jgi:hypothetical protein
MTLKLNRLALASAICIGTLATGNISANAMPLLNGPQIDTNQTLNVDYVPSGRMGYRTGWQMQRDGNRCRSRFGNCRHFHRGYYYETPWWTLPIVIGSAVATGGHVQWCMSHYRSYNPHTNMWLGNSGRFYQCNSSN